MSLNRVLELSEANMSEGEYLEVANILKEINNNLPSAHEEQGLLKYELFDNTRLLCEAVDCECLDSTCGISIPFHSLKFLKFNNRTDYWLISEIEVYDKKIKASNFKEFLQIRLKSTMSVNFHFYTDDHELDMVFNFKKYVSFFIERYDNRWGDDDPPNEFEIFDDYIKFIADQIYDYFKICRSE